MTTPLPLYIDGAWTGSAGTQSLDVVDPTREAVLAAVPTGDVADVDRAVAAAAAAFPGWAAAPRTDRAELLRRLRAELARRGDEIAALISRDVGTPIGTAQRVQVGLPLTVIDTIVEILDRDSGEERLGNSLIVREPAGVVAAITPWNYPLHQSICKIVPALAVGCSVVLKPSEVAPLAIQVLFEAIDAVGFPAGVANLVHGTGTGTGLPLVEHRDIDVVSFTGSTTAGGKVAATAAGAIKRVALELGGKSANVILDDADLAAAVDAGVTNAFRNGGQTCSAWTRMLVPAARHDDAVDLAVKAASGFVLGDPLDPATTLGPMVSAVQRDRVRHYIRTGIDSGAHLATGGADAPADLERGFYVAPTVFGAVDPDSVIAQEEIFGPVLSIIPHRGDADALAIANNSRYGLSGAVWSGDRDRALAFARQVRTGQIDVNGAAYNPDAPFGGYKASGVGREKGSFGMDEFVEVKSIQL